MLEKWIKDKPISAVYFDLEKDKYFVKRFIIENENREEVFISEHPYSRLEIISTDYRPVAEIVFAKNKGIQKENMELNFEEFIAVKGIKAQGNQLTSDKIKTISLLESLPYEPPVEDVQEDKEFEDVDEINLTVEEDGQMGMNLG